tara:strand:- start:7167 stop:10403 length:3237 start_codon:yes stop_codon:yes gene_type:complete
MRISTPFQYMHYNHSLLDNQIKLNESIEKISAGKRIITAGDDPTAMITVDNLHQYNDALSQYATNITGANYRAGFAETTLGSMDDLVLRARDLILQGNNGAIDRYGRENIAYELDELYAGMLSFVNSKDESDNYVFSGYSTNVKPFDQSNGGDIEYLGDSGEQRVMIDAQLSTIVNMPGDKLILNALNPAGELQAYHKVESQGMVTVESGMRNPNLDPSYKLTIQDQYELEFSQRAGTKVDWVSPLDIPQNRTYHIMVTDEDGHYFNLTLGPQESLDPNQPNGISLRDRMRTAIRNTALAGDPALDVSERFVVKSTIDGQGNSFYVKHWDDTKKMHISITEANGQDFDPDFDVKIIDENDKTNALHLQPNTDSDLAKTTYNIHEFQPEFLGSNHTLNMSFDFNVPAGAQNIAFNVSEHIRDKSELIAHITESLNMNFAASTAAGVNQLQAVALEDGFEIQDRMRIMSNQQLTLGASTSGNPFDPNIPTDMKLVLSTEQLKIRTAFTVPVTVPATVTLGMPQLPILTTLRDPKLIQVEPGKEGDPVTDVSVTVNQGDKVRSYDFPQKLTTLNDFDLAYDLESRTVRLTNELTDKVVPRTLKPTIKHRTEVQVAGTTNAQYTLLYRMVDESGLVVAEVNAGAPNTTIAGNAIGSQFALDSLLRGVDFSAFADLEGVKSAEFKNGFALRDRDTLVIELEEGYTEAYTLETSLVLDTVATAPGVPPPGNETLQLSFAGQSTANPQGVIANTRLGLSETQIDVAQLSERELIQKLAVSTAGTSDSAHYQILMEFTEVGTQPPYTRNVTIDVPPTQGGITQEAIDTAIKAHDFSGFESLPEVTSVSYSLDTNEFRLELYTDDREQYNLNTSLQLINISTVSASDETFVLSIDGQRSTSVEDVVAGGVVPPYLQPVDLINHPAGPAVVTSESVIPDDAIRASEDFFTLIYRGRPDTGDVLALGLNETRHVNIFDTMRSVIDKLRNISDNGVFHETLNYGRLLQEFDSARNHLTQNRAELGIRLRQLDLIEYFHEDIKLINTTIISPLEDLDYSVAIAEMTQREMALNALAAVFTRIAGSVLFDYI